MLMPSNDDWPHPERIQPMDYDDESGRGFIRWALGLLVLAAVLGGLAYGYTLPPGPTECDDAGLACERQAAK